MEGNSLLGFYEILVWIIAITKIMQNITDFFYYIVYVGGFAAGIYFGVLIEERLALGLVSIHVFTELKKLEYDKEAFISVEDVRLVKGGIFSHR